MRITFKSIIGKHILIGITILDANDTVVEQVQTHGIIKHAKRGQTIKVKLFEDAVPDLPLFKEELFSLPPDIRSIKVAPEGDYTLKSTGEVVTDPDLLTTWTITPNGQEDMEL